MTEKKNQNKRGLTRPFLACFARLISSSTGAGYGGAGASQSGKRRLTFKGRVQQQALKSRTRPRQLRKQRFGEHGVKVERQRAQLRHAGHGVLHVGVPQRQRVAVIRRKEADAHFDRGDVQQAQTRPSRRRPWHRKSRSSSGRKSMSSHASMYS
jgi:hypothetical protein